MGLGNQFIPLLWHLMPSLNLLLVCSELDKYERRIRSDMERMLRENNERMLKAIT